MTDVFISYAHEDHDYVRRMAPALEAEGFSVWWDHTIPPGKTWDEVIAKGIADARCCIVLWSKSSVVSDWVKEEATIAKDHRKFIPVQIDNSEPPVGFRRIQAAHLQNWNGNVSDPQWQMLSREIRSVVSTARAAGAATGAAPSAAPAYTPRAQPSYNAPPPQRGGPPPVAIGIMAVAALVAVVAIAMAVMPGRDAPQQQAAVGAPTVASAPATDPALERMRGERDEALRRAEAERVAREQAVAQQQAEAQRLRREQESRAAAFAGTTWTVRRWFTYPDQQQTEPFRITFRANGRFDVNNGEYPNVGSWRQLENGVSFVYDSPPNTSYRATRTGGQARGTFTTTSAEGWRGEFEMTRN